MKKVLLILMMSFVTEEMSANDSLKERIRNLYRKAAVEEESCRKLIESIPSQLAQTDATLTGYKASGMMIMAKHLVNPFARLMTFSDGKKLLEQVIQSNRKNVELRFLRFSIQTHVPAFLNYDENIEEDKLILLANVKLIAEPGLRQLVTSALLDSEQVTLAEKQRIK